MLVYMIFAMGAFDLGTDGGADKAHQYFETARTILRQILLDEGSMELVQALAIMGNYLQRRDSPNSGYMCLGFAIRMAMALGLHNPAAARGSSVLDDEMRYRVWWGLVTLEAGCSFTFGRPPIVGYASLLAVRLPLNIEDEDLPVGEVELPQETSDVTIYSALITQARLAKVAFYLQDRLARSLPAPTVAQIQWCGEHFRREVCFLPTAIISPDEPFALARAVQIWRARDYRSVIYRPVLLAIAWDPQSRSDSDARVKQIIRSAHDCIRLRPDDSTCRSLATDNVREISQFIDSGDDRHRGCEWYILYFAFQACLTLLLSIVREPAHPDAVIWRHDVEGTIQIFHKLTSMGKVGKTADYADHIDRFVLCSFHGEGVGREIGAGRARSGLGWSSSVGRRR
jgi:transcriptional regulatory protein GAL4